MVLLQAGSVQAESCYFWLVLNNRGSCQTDPWFFDPLQTGLTEQLSMSWVSLHYPCGRNRGPELCWGVPEAAIKTWQNSLHGISMMEKGLSACRFSHMQSTYHLLGDLFAISQICFRCSLYSLISAWGGRRVYLSPWISCSMWSLFRSHLLWILGPWHLQHKNPPINC